MNETLSSWAPTPPRSEGSRSRKIQAAELLAPGCLSFCTPARKAPGARSPNDRGRWNGGFEIGLGWLSPRGTRTSNHNDKPTTSTINSTDGCLIVDRNSNNSSNNNEDSATTCTEDDGESISLGSLYRDFYKDLPAQVPLDNNNCRLKYSSASPSGTPDQQKNSKVVLPSTITHSNKGRSGRSTPATQATSVSSSSLLSSFRLDGAIPILPLPFPSEEKDSDRSASSQTEQQEAPMLVHFHQNSPKSAPRTSARIVSSRLHVVSPEAPLARGEELNDRFQVAIRLRPLDDDDSSKANYVAPRSEPQSPSGRLRLRRPLTPTQSPTAWNVQEETTLVQSTIAKPVSGRHLFSFDSVFEASATTEQVYQRVAQPVVHAVAEGKHGTIFAYGPTGSGKTYTMLGLQDGSSPSGRTGIVQLAARDLLAQMKAQSPERDHVVRAMFFEVYNEQVRDLLVKRDSDGGAVEVTVRDEADGTPVVSAVEQRIECIDHVNDLIELGVFNRSCAATSINAQSSRSHAIVRLIVTSRSKTDSTCIRHSVLNLVDLAGSENSKQAGLTGIQKREGGKINQSLLSLSRVIHALSLPAKKRPRHIGYRDSKLTRILQPHLSGNACLAVLCCVSPSHGCVEETRSALKFAANAKRIQVKPVVNDVVDQQALLLSLRKELQETKEALRMLQEQFGGTPDDHLSKAVAEKIAGGSVATSICETPSTEQVELSYSRSCDVSETSTTLHTPLSPPRIFGGSVSLISPEKTTPSRSQLLEHVVGRLEFDGIEQDSHEETDASSEAVVGDDSQEFQKMSEITRIDIPAADVGVDFPLTEVVVMMESPTSQSEGGTSRLEDRLKAAEERATFLAEKLDTTDDLVESLFKELRAEQAKTLQLVAENRELQTYIESLSKKEVATTEDMNLLLQQFLVLKCGICVGIFMYICGETGGFLMTILFLWLTLSVVQN